VRDVRVTPWYKVHVDLISPWRVSVNGIECAFKALTMINPVTNLVGIVCYRNKMAQHIARLFEDTWLSRYPRPMRVVCDQGPEFKGAFGTLMRFNGIEWHSASAKNPTANSICKRVHLTIGNVLWTLVRAHPPQDLLDVSELVDQCLATAMHATRNASHGSLDDLSPGALVFQRDMFLDISLVADIMAITAKREVIVNNSLLQANQAPLTYDFNVSKQVLIKVPNPDKRQDCWKGPFGIKQVHCNGTVTLRILPLVTDQVSMEAEWKTDFKSIYFWRMRDVFQQNCNPNAFP
jgi:hypothetical protein